MQVENMTLEQLKNYYGAEIKVNDFEEYWNNQKNIIDNHLINFNIKEKVFKNKKAKYFHLEFRALDNSIIYAKYIKPNTEKKVPLVLEFHDYKESSKSWHYLNRYVGIGYGVLAMDARGQGGRSLDLSLGKGSTSCGHLIKGIDGNIDDLYYRNLYLDGYMLSKIIEKLEGIDLDKIITFGKGQGAAVAIAVAALNKKVKKCSAEYSFLADFKRVWEMDLDKNFYEGIRYYFKFFDPIHVREQEFFKKLAYIDVVNFAPMLHCELLMGTALLDEICPPSTQFAIFNNVNCKKKHLIFPKHGHELNNFFQNENLKFMKF